ncbi:NAD(P)H-dependent glutamate synthase small subunit [Kushneria sinocarnis]|uniref:NAD(P)H-dependent glutamate synthase small subunit n=1 Tax=Kushneria sinocarnis TaxID=595502 RepID=A0A420WWK1_9GAMM|nr:glutamate synthase subunit beta [Kushneria sinocarnis]RKR03489.1 NAD(P)H-dependent glutamate synthase small subunit [Kushneria sinocarnis]
MTERHPNGFLKHERQPIGKRPPDERVQDYQEIYAPVWQEDQLREQGERCMDCGVPACMGGCPIGNLIPEWNDLVYRGLWREALDRLHATNNFPEFTGYTCPAPCEPACTLAYNADPVTIKDIERAIVDRGWEMGWITPQPPTRRSGRSVAVIGSGPAGLACAQQLNRAGHRVSVFERNDAIGGLMSRGIPDFKFAKYQVARRVGQLEAEGIEFHTGARIGVDPDLARLNERFDAVCLAIGALEHRNVELPGRELAGIHFGMDYLTAENRRQAGGRGSDDDTNHARDRHVVVLGGGDTGADCVATAHRQGAASVVQVSVRARAPGERPADNPWPLQPKTYKRTYAIDEGGEEAFSLDVTAFLDEDNDGRVDVLLADRVEWTLDEHGRRVDRTVTEAGVRLAADLVLIAIGFTGPEANDFAASGLALTRQGTFVTDDTMMTSREGIFATGDARRGQSLVVWAIGEGRDAARHIDSWLTGRPSRLPASLQTHNPPTEAG